MSHYVCCKKFYDVCINNKEYLNIIFAEKRNELKEKFVFDLKKLNIRLEINDSKKIWDKYFNKPQTIKF